MEWPERRAAHAATCVSGPLLVIMGGAMIRETMTSDCWIYDFTTMLWKKVLVIVFVVFYDLIACVTSCTVSFLPCARMRSRVMHLVALVCVYVYVYTCICGQKNWLF